jgi:hypothetical protein
MNAMCSIVAYRLTPVSVPEFQVLLDKMLKKRVNDKLRSYWGFVSNGTVVPGASAPHPDLETVVWNVLSRREADQHADLDAVGRSLLVWGWKNKLATSLGMKPAEFTAKRLHKLGIRLEKVSYCSRIYQIPIVELTQN